MFSGTHSDRWASKQAQSTSRSLASFSFSDDELDDWAQDDADDDADDEEAKALRDNILDAVFDYGPPYSDDSGGNLLLEVAGPLPSLSKVHSLLLNGANPNEHEKDDVGLTPMHYAARFWLTNVLRLFRHARGDHNATNELGQTALGFALLFIGKHERRRKQLRTVQLLCEMGANPNVLDRGGFTPLAYAARNNDTACVRILLRHGANVTRRYRHLSIPYQNAIDLATNQKCRALLQAKASEEQRLDDERQAKQRQRREESDRIMRAKEIEDEKAERRRNERLGKAEARTEQFKQWKTALRKERFEQELIGHRQQFKVTHAKQQSWVRVSPNGWELQQLAGQRTQVSYLDECNKQFDQFKKHYSYESLNKRWKDVTGNELERNIARAGLFDDVKLANETTDLDEDITSLGDIANLLAHARQECSSASGR